MFTSWKKHFDVLLKKLDLMICTALRSHLQPESCNLRISVVRFKWLQMESNVILRYTVTWCLLRPMLNLDSTCRTLRAGVKNNYIMKPITLSDSFTKSPNTDLIVDYRVMAQEFCLLKIVWLRWVTLIDLISSGYPRLLTVSTWCLLDK